jgi:wyosine [tRNA(Phe)-imidazoG37] synthetase (radical SAM superfamily)
MMDLLKTSSERMMDAWQSHERRWKNHLYVYAVVSRRSRGISVGLNLMPCKACNFNCVYCQVNRQIPSTVTEVDLKRLEEELDAILAAEKQGSLYEDAPFNVLTPEERGVRDIAFSGDGEPTLCPQFEAAVRIAARIRTKYYLASAKLVLITNAACLDKLSVRSALELMDQNNGEIWAKLDAGTEEYFQQVNRSPIPLDRILKNILDVSRLRPLVLQSLWFRIQGCNPPVEEIAAYCNRLKDLISAGGRIKAVQLYTIARNPAEKDVSPLETNDLRQIAATVSAAVSIPVSVY